ncbi:hypothetical protein BWQ96_04425 [Gracilariopsis chorda]|uniref:Tudor domain-containing protein n=1 Tax=Gracilariopsis chorda TaxID=448386 RepID=A0A2V3IUM0_9FLOR|nr:hypothetical protein BWQ96_04425 [Gracilariopsis chorda]|eukprot:PXF45813.1 hypothetical protein BWQ96_04425 [Gracilariopsis chorda]
MSAHNDYLMEQLQLGDEIQVWWAVEKQYFNAVVDRVLPNGRYHVTYEDGEEETMRLTAERWRFKGRAAHRVAVAHPAPLTPRKRCRNTASTTHPETIVIHDDDPPPKRLQTTVHSNIPHPVPRKPSTEPRSISTQQSDVDIHQSSIQIIDHSPHSHHRASDVSDPTVSDNDQSPVVLDHQLLHITSANPTPVAHSNKPLANTTAALAQPAPVNKPLPNAHRLPSHPSPPPTHPNAQPPAPANTQQNTVSSNSNTPRNSRSQSKKRLSTNAPVQNAPSDPAPTLANNAAQSPPNNRLNTRVSQTAASKSLPTPPCQPKQTARKKKHSANAASRSSKQTNNHQPSSASKSSPAPALKPAKKPSARNASARKPKPTATTDNQHLSLPPSSKPLAASQNAPHAKSIKRARKKSTPAANDQPLKAAQSHPPPIVLAPANKRQASVKAKASVAAKAVRRQSSHSKATPDTHNTPPNAPFKRTKKRVSPRQLTATPQPATPQPTQSASAQKSLEQSTILPHLLGYNRKGARMLSTVNNNEREENNVQQTATQLPATSDVPAKSTSTNPPATTDSAVAVVNKRSTEGQQTTAKTDKSLRTRAAQHDSSPRVTASATPRAQPSRKGKSTSLSAAKGVANSSQQPHAQETCSTAIPATNPAKAPQTGTSEIQNGAKADNASQPTEAADTNKGAPPNGSQQTPKKSAACPTKRSNGMSEQKKPSTLLPQKRRARMSFLKSTPSAAARLTKGKRNGRNTESEKVAAEQTQVAQIRSPATKQQNTIVTASTPTKSACPPIARDLTQVSARHPSPKLVTSERIPRNKPPMMTLSNWPPSDLEGAQHANVPHTQPDQYRWIEPAQSRMNITYHRSPAQSDPKTLHGNITPNMYSANTRYPTNAPTFLGAGTVGTQPPNAFHGQGNLPIPLSVAPVHHQPAQPVTKPPSNASASMSIRSLVSGPSALPMLQNTPSLPHPPPPAMIPRGLSMMSPAANGPAGKTTGAPTDPNTSTVRKTHSLTLKPLRPMIGFAQTSRASPATGVLAQGQLPGRQTFDQSSNARLNFTDGRTLASPVASGIPAGSWGQQISSTKHRNSSMNTDECTGFSQPLQAEQLPDIQGVRKRSAIVSQPNKEIVKKRKDLSSGDFTTNCSPPERSDHSQRTLHNSAPSATTNAEAVVSTQQTVVGQFMRPALGDKANSLGQNRNKTSQRSHDQEAMAVNLRSSRRSTGDNKISSEILPAGTTGLNSENRGGSPMLNVKSQNAVHSLQIDKPTHAAAALTSDPTTSSGVGNPTLPTASKVPRSSAYARPRRRSQQKGRKTPDKADSTALEIASIIAELERSLSAPFLSHVEMTWRTKFEKVAQLFGNLKEESKEQSRVIHELKVRMDKIESATESFAKLAGDVLDVQSTLLPATALKICKQYETELTSFVQAEADQIDAICKSTTKKVAEMNSDLVAAVLQKVQEGDGQDNGIKTSAGKASGRAKPERPAMPSAPHRHYLESAIPSGGQMGIALRMHQNPSMNNTYPSASNNSKSSPQPFVVHEKEQPPFLRESLDLIAKCVVQWLQKGECRKRAPKNEREVQVPQPWVRLTSLKCLSNVLSRLSAFKSYTEARESLNTSTKDARMETDWLTRFWDDNAIEKARNIYNWEPRLFDFEWRTEKKVILEIVDRIHSARSNLKSTLLDPSDPLEYSVACVTSSVRT